MYDVVVVNLKKKKVQCLRIFRWRREKKKSRPKIRRREKFRRNWEFLFHRKKEATARLLL